jgi:hypothetical protein
VERTDALETRLLGLSAKLCVVVRANVRTDGVPPLSLAMVSVGELLTEGVSGRVKATGNVLLVVVAGGLASCAGAVAVLVVMVRTGVLTTTPPDWVSCITTCQVPSGSVLLTAEKWVASLVTAAGLKANDPLVATLLSVSVTGALTVYGPD